MSGREMKKYTGVAGKDRWDIFLNRIATGDKLTYQPNGQPSTQVVIPGAQNPQLVAALTNKSPVDYMAAFKAGVQAVDVSTGAPITINTPYDIFKDTAFGSTDPYAAEKIQVSALKSYLSSLKRKKKKGNIWVYIGPAKGAVPVDDIKHITGPQKRDIALLYRGQEVAYVSLKSANNPDQMMQWGGVSYLMSAMTSNLSVGQFASKVRSSFASGRSTPMYKLLKGDPIGLDAVYGDNRDVDLVAASKNLTFVQCAPGVYCFSGTVFYNPTLPTGYWEPVLMALPSSDRNDQGIPGARIGIYPLGFANAHGAILVK